MTKKQPIQKNVIITQYNLVILVALVPELLTIIYFMIVSIQKRAYFELETD